MKPLILDFAEAPEKIDLDYSIIEYSDTLNLSVLKGTQEVAIEKANLSTETFTKSQGETSDSDQSNKRLKNIVETMTKTQVHKESSDSDRNFSPSNNSMNENTLHKLKLLMDTRTLTETKEATDSDR